MKKIFVISGAVHATIHVLTSAVEIAKRTATLLNGIFLSPIANRQVPEQEYLFPNDLGLAGTQHKEQVAAGEAKIVRDNIWLFTDLCNAAKLHFKVSSAKDTSLENLLKHSAFADLLLMNATMGFSNMQTDYSEVFSLPVNVSVADLLADVHCPVLLL